MGGAEMPRPIFLWSPRIGASIHYDHEPDAPTRTPRFFYEDKSGTLLLSSAAGLSRLDEASEADRSGNPVWSDPAVPDGVTPPTSRIKSGPKDVLPFEVSQ